MSRILVVDDNRQNLYMLEAALKGVGHEVSPAANGAEALALARKTLPELVISDILMPVMDGYELCRQWKADETLRKVPFIIYTATYTDPRDEKFALSLGADRFILKPAKIEALQEAVKDVLAQARRGGIRLPAGNVETMKEYKDALARKLEDKVRQLEWEIAARRSAEESLRSERNRAQSYLEMAGVIIVLIDAAGNVRLINKKGCAILGYEERELLGHSLMDHLPGTQRETARGIFAKIVSGEILSLESYEANILTKAGEERSILWHNTILRGELGEFTGVLSAGEDFTERKRMEDKLLKLSRALEQSPSLVMITDVKGNIEYVNPKFSEVTGYTLEELRGNTPRVLKSGDKTPEDYRKLWETISGGGIWRGEFHNRRKDGALYWERAAIAPVRAPSGEIIAYFGTKEDITAQKVLEAELAQAQKMQSVGQLAGGVAHDFNNLLGAISGYAGFLLRGMPADDPRREDAEGILAVVERASALTKQLLIFSRKQIVNPAVIDINEVAAGSVKMLRRLITEDIKLEARLDPRPCVVLADAGQIGQVLMNLAVNARDAMQHGGTLTISTGTASMPDEFFADAPDLKRGPLVFMKIADTGCGMTEEVKARAFEPFFTTKEKGKGTGLGLATVYGIVKQAGGEVRIESSPGAGTTFLIYFPEAAAAPESATPKGTGRTLSGSECVLLVEDDDMLRKVNERILVSGGYTVLTASNGQEAMNALERRGKAVDLVITDVVLPGINGRQLAREMQAKGLSARTLYVSGYTDDTILQHGILETGIAFLNKPFSAEALLMKVREVLEGRGDAARA